MLGSTIQQIGECVNEREFILIKESILLFQKNLVRDEELKKVEGILHPGNPATVNLVKVEKLVELLCRKEYILPTHKDFLLFVLKQSNETILDDLELSVDMIKEDLSSLNDSIKDFTLESIETTPDTNETKIIGNIQVSDSYHQDSFHLRVGLDCVVCDKSQENSYKLCNTESVSSQELETMQYLLSYFCKVKAPSKCIILIHQFLKDIIHSKISKLQKEFSKKLTIPFMPPVHELPNFQILTKSLKLQSHTVDVIENFLLSKSYEQCPYYSTEEIIDYVPIIQPERIELFINCLKEFHERGDDIAAVTMGYHGASRETAESIADDGLLSPGEFTKKGHLIEVMNGSIFGEGVYVSPNIHKAMNYSYANSRIAHIIVSLVAPGKHHRCPHPFYNEKEGRYIPYNFGKPVDNADSHVSPNQDEIVLFRSEQVLPILYLKVSTYRSLKKNIFMKIESKKKFPYSKLPPVSTKEKTFMEKLDLKHCHLPFFQIPGAQDLYCINLSRTELERFSILSTNPIHVHTIFIGNKTSSLGKAFHMRLLPVFKELYQKIQPNSADMVFYGKSAESFPISSASFFDEESIKNMKLENQRNILAGYTTAVDLALKRKQKIAESGNIQSSDIVFVFVLVTDGEDNVNNQVKITKTIADYDKYLKANNIQSIFQLLLFGKAKSQLVMPFKLYSQTITLFYEHTPFYYAPTASKLINAANELGNVLTAMLKSFKGTQISFSDDSYHSGFVYNLTKIPKKEHFVQLEEETGILVYGIPPPTVILNYFQAVRLLHVGFQHKDINFVLKIIQRLVMDVKIAAIAGEDTTKAVQTLSSIIKEVKYNCFFIHGLTTVERAAFMKVQKQLVFQLEEQMNSIHAAIRFFSSDKKLDETVSWLQAASEMKFGAQALHRTDKFISMGNTSIVYDLDKISKDNSDVQFYQDKDHKSILSGLSGTEHWQRIQCELEELNELRGLTITELLYSLGMIGYGIKLTRSESSNINPWTIIVDYVSHEIMDSSDTLCLLDAGIAHEDSNGTIIEDVVIVPNPANPKPYELFLQSKLYKSYLGVVFTRNPELVLPQQHTALVMVSFVKAIEQLMNPKYRTHGNLQSIFEMYLHIKDIIHQSAHYWEKLVQKLYNSKPGLYMTESDEDDVVSVVKILAPLCCSDLCSDLFTQKNMFNQLCEVALALLAEVTSRSCRVLVKREGMYRRANALVRKALGITVENTNVPNWTSPSDLSKLSSLEISPEYSKIAGKKYSSRLFMKEWTNCSPKAVVACLGFGKLLQQYTAKKDIRYFMETQETESMFNYFIAEFSTITMRNFITEYVPNVDPMDLQIAMYVQGLCHHSSKDRKDGLASLLNPKPVIEEIAKKERQMIIMDALHARFRDMKKEIALAELLLEQKEFLKYHSGLPRIFTFPEVGHMNQSRPDNDQLELLPESGLLKHHCCFPSCPKYLSNLATEDDIRNGRRNGLFGHMSRFVVPNRKYQPGFHTLCKTTFPSCKNKNQFITKMLDTLLTLRNEKLKLWKSSRPEWESSYTSLLSDYWDQKSQH